MENYQLHQKQIEEYLKQHLVFLTRDQFSARTEGCLQLALGLQQQDGNLSLLAYVSKSESGYWWFTNHPMLITKADPENTFDKKRDAAKDAYGYVYRECYRILAEGAKVTRFIKLPEWAAAEASSASIVADTSDHDAFVSGFTHGFCKAVSEYGLGPQPKWAKYLVQNRDGSFTWFQNKPKPEHNSGNWEAVGKKKTIRLTESWSHSIREL